MSSIYVTGSILYSLPLLACPVGMGAMMWLMMRGQKHDQPMKIREHAPSDVASPASIELLREEHRRLGEHIDNFEQAEQRPAPRS